MFGMGGLRLAEILKTERPELPVLATGYSQEIIDTGARAWLRSDSPSFKLSTGLFFGKWVISADGCFRPDGLALLGEVHDLPRNPVSSEADYVAR